MMKYDGKKYLNVFLVLLRSLSSLCFLPAWFFSLQRPLQVPVTAHLLQRSCFIFSLTFCSLNECFNALHNTSFHLENIFQMLGLEHGELDDKYLIVGNKNFSYVVPGHTPMPH